MFVRGGGVFPYLGMNFQYKVAPRLILQIELDYYHNMWDSEPLILPCFNVISLFKQKNLDDDNVIPYFSFGLGIAANSYLESSLEFRAVLGFYKIGIGQKFRLFKNSFANAAISANIPFFYFIPLFPGVSLSLDLGFEIRF